MCNSTSDRQKKSYSVLLVNFLFAPVLVSILIATGPVFFFTSQSVSAVYRDYEIEM